MNLTFIELIFSNYVNDILYIDVWVHLGVNPTVIDIDMPENNHKSALVYILISREYEQLQK